MIFYLFYFYLCVLLQFVFYTRVTWCLHNIKLLGIQIGDKKELYSQQIIKQIVSYIFSVLGGV